MVVNKLESGTNLFVGVAHRCQFVSYAPSSITSHYTAGRPFINMLFAARRLVARAPAALRVAPTPVNSASRLFTSSALRFAAGPPVIQGPGAKDGEMPTDEQQATGLERFELLGKLKGVDVFDMEPLQMTHLGTTDNPIKIKSFVSNLCSIAH